MVLSDLHSHQLEALSSWEIEDAERTSVVDSRRAIYRKG